VVEEAVSAAVHPVEDLAVEAVASEEASEEAVSLVEALAEAGKKNTDYLNKKKLHFAAFFMSHS
jgi:hypothetical protein